MSHDPAQSGPDAFRDASRGERLQRVLADAGIASRRVGEQLIEQGRVSVNGQVVRTLPAWVDPARDEIRVNGSLLPKPEPHLYIMLNKPARTLSTPPEGPDDARKSALGLVRHPLSSRLVPAGRLDFEATGLLLLTNDGDLVHRLTHARYGVEKTYQMVVRGTIDDGELARVQDALARMLRVGPPRGDSPRAGANARRSPRRPRPDDQPVRTRAVPRPADPPTLRAIARESGRTVLELTSKDTSGGDLRDALAALGHPVKSLERIAIGPLRLRGVAPGHWRELERSELIDLRRAAAGKPARGRADGGEDGRPKVAKRFRGIGRPILAKSPAPRRVPPRPPEGQPSTDVRRGRGESVNAKRRKAERSGAGGGGPAKNAGPRRTGSRSAKPGGDKPRAARAQGRPRPGGSGRPGRAEKRR